MNASNWAVGVALFIGSVRAVELWRSAPKADVVNVAVLSAFAEGRGSELDRLLGSVGSAPYFALVRALVQPIEKLASGDEREVRKRLEHDMMRALAVANLALRRFAWLDSFALVAIAFAGLSSAIDGKATPILALELLAATLLWLANVRARRSIATRMYAGATALVDGLVRGLELIRRANPG